MILDVLGKAASYVQIEACVDQNALLVEFGSRHALEANQTGHIDDQREESEDLRVGE